MSEYWKSTPRYWCKFCSVYVRDTPMERRNHESTGRHQGSIQRSLKNIHKEHEREERETQRAKDEVARLKGTAAAAAAAAAGDAGVGARRKGVAPGGAAPARQATVEERKRQMQQLADMGIEVPEEFRRDMAMAGEWHTVQRAPGAPRHQADLEAEGGVKSVGVRKRKTEGGGDDDDDDESAFGEKKPKAWGSALKSYPGSKGAADGFDELLGGVRARAVTKQEPEVKAEDVDGAKVKLEDGEGLVSGTQTGTTAASDNLATEVKLEDEGQRAPEAVATASSVVFKKRKKRA